MTQGFSPRAKISFAPELPAGVLALNEPADMYFVDTQDDIKTLLNISLPEGFNISQVLYPEENSPSLGKMCTHAEYFLRCKSCIPVDFFGDSLVDVDSSEDWQKVIISSPAQNPIGGLVKFMMRENIISGWHEINIVRSAIGILSEGRVIVRE